MLNQLENVQRDLNQKEVELKHLTAQLEVLTNNNAAQVEELQKEISTLKVRTAFLLQKTPFFVCFSFFELVYNIVLKL